MRGTFFNRRSLQRFRQVAISAVGGMKIKLVLVCFIVFTLIVLAGRAANFMGWRHQTASVDRLAVPRSVQWLVIICVVL